MAQESFVPFDFMNVTGPIASKSPITEAVDLSLDLSLGGHYRAVPVEKPLLQSPSLNGCSASQNDLVRFLTLKGSALAPEKNRVEGVNWGAETQWKEVTVVRRLPQPRGASSSRSLVIQGPENSTTTKVPVNPQHAVFSNYEVKDGKSRDTSNDSYPEPVALTFGIVSVPEEMTTPPPPPAYIRKMEKGKGKMIETRETEGERVAKKAKVVPVNGIKDPATLEMLRQMPCVTTTGIGPNGRKVEGYLYNYIGEKVKIVCVCHGRFLSPVQFVEHAGGTDVTDPMKHIKVMAPILAIRHS